MPVFLVIHILSTIILVLTVTRPLHKNSVQVVQASLSSIESVLYVLQPKIPHNAHHAFPTILTRLHLHA